MCGCLLHNPSLRTWPTTQTGALTGSQTGNPWVCRLVLNPLSHTSQDWSLYSQFADSFYHKWVLDFITCFLCIYRYDYVVCILHFVYVVYHIYWFANIIPTLHSQNKSHFIMVDDLSDAWCICFANILLRILVSMFIGNTGHLLTLHKIIHSKWILKT